MSGLLEMENDTSALDNIQDLLNADVLRPEAPALVTSTSAAATAAAVTPTPAPVMHVSEPIHHAPPTNNTQVARQQGGQNNVRFSPQSILKNSAAGAAGAAAMAVGVSSLSNNGNYFNIFGMQVNKQTVYIVIVFLVLVGVYIWWSRRNVQQPVQQVQHKHQHSNKKNRKHKKEQPKQESASEKELTESDSSTDSS